MLILEAVVIPIDKHTNITKILGSKNIKSKPNFIFDEHVINFLNEIYLFANNIKEIRDYPDLFSFAFWCRKKNIINLKSKYTNHNKRIGRGIVYHITPSNVPMNFAYSFAFGMLSGNFNIVRLPSKKFHQINIFINIIKKYVIKKNIE